MDENSSFITTGIVFTNKDSQILCVSTPLPEGHIESYAKHSLTGWTYQIVEIDIWDEHIMEVKNISMKKLKKLYG